MPPTSNTGGKPRRTYPDCLAGDGVRGGQVHGASDKFGAYPADLPVAPEDIAKTIYFAMGIADLEAVDRKGKPFRLLVEQAALKSLF